MTDPNTEVTNDTIEQQLTDRFIKYDTPQEPEPDEDDPEQAEDAPESEVKEPADESDAEQQDPDAEVIFEIDGKPISRAQAKEGLMLKEDYTRKTTDAAERVRATEAERMALQAQRQADRVVEADKINVGVLEFQLKQYDAVDLSALAVNDPATAIRVQTEIAKLRSAKADAEKLLEENRRKAAQVEYYRGQQTLQLARAEIIKRIPDFTSQEVQSGLGKLLLDAGYSREVIQAAIDDPYSMVNDPMAMTIAHKAFLWDKLQASRPAVTKKAESVTKTLTPKGQTPQGNRDKQTSELRDRFRKSKSDDDAIALLLAKGTRRK